MSLFGDILGGVAGLGAAVGDTAVGLENLRLQRDQYEWEKSAQEKTWAREDNAVQRRAADLEAAGMSKTLAAGAAASSSSPIAVHAPQLRIDPVRKGMETASVVANMLQQRANIARTEEETKVVHAQFERANLENDVLRRTLEGTVAGRNASNRITVATEEAVVRKAQAGASLEEQRRVTEQWNTLIRQNQSASANFKAELDQIRARVAQKYGVSGAALEFASKALALRVLEHDVPILEGLPIPSGMLNAAVGAGASLVGRAVSGMME